MAKPPGSPPSLMDKLRGVVPTSPEQPEQVEKPRSNPELVTFLQEGGHLLNINPHIVYYPFCGTDISPEIAFPNSQIIYADNNASCVTTMTDDSRDIHEESATSWAPEKPIDFLLLSNPGDGVPIDTPLQALAENGFVACTKYHGVAERIYSNPKFILLGVVRKDQQETYQLDNESLADYFTPVSDDESWQNSTPERFEMSYSDAKTIIDELYPEEAPAGIFETYTKLLETAADQAGEEAKNLPFLSYTINEKKYQLKKLPKKKTLGTNLLIFQKKATETSE